MIWLFKWVYLIVWVSTLISMTIELLSLGEFKLYLYVQYNGLYRKWILRAYFTNLNNYKHEIWRDKIKMDYAIWNYLRFLLVLESKLIYFFIIWMNCCLIAKNKISRLFFVLDYIWTVVRWISAYLMDKWLRMVISQTHSYLTMYRC